MPSKMLRHKHSISHVSHLLAVNTAASGPASGENASHTIDIPRSLESLQAKASDKVVGLLQVDTCPGQGSAGMQAGQPTVSATQQVPEPGQAGAASLRPLTHPLGTQLATALSASKVDITHSVFAPPTTYALADCTNQNHHQQQSQQQQEAVLHEHPRPECPISVPSESPLIIVPIAYPSNRHMKLCKHSIQSLANSKHSTQG